MSPTSMNVTIKELGELRDIYQPFPSDDVRHYVELVNLAILSFPIALVGSLANIVNLIVFFRQGMDSTLNVALAALAISDLCSLLTLLLFVIWLSPLLAVLGVPVKPSEAQHLTAGLPHGCFTRITSWITAYIAAERCLCVAYPLKIKRILTPRRTTGIIACIYILMIVSLFPEYITLYLDWIWDAVSNRFLLGLTYRYNNLHLDGLTFLVYSLYMFASFVTVTLLTVILIVKLKNNAKWRKSATVDIDRSQRISNREQKAVKITLTLASLLIITFCPTIMVSMCGFLVPGFSVIGRYSNLFFLSWSFVQVFDATNASINIYLYYRLSSSYRRTFHELFPWCFTKELASTKQL